MFTHDSLCCHRIKYNQQYYRQHHKRHNTYFIHPLNHSMHLSYSSKFYNKKNYVHIAYVQHITTFVFFQEEYSNLNHFHYIKTYFRELHNLFYAIEYQDRFLFKITILFIPHTKDGKVTLAVLKNSNIP